MTVIAELTMLLLVGKQFWKWCLSVMCKLLDKQQCQHCKGGNVWWTILQSLFPLDCYLALQASSHSVKEATGKSYFKTVTDLEVGYLCCIMCVVPANLTQSPLEEGSLASRRYAGTHQLALILEKLYFGKCVGSRHSGPWCPPPTSCYAYRKEWSSKMKLEEGHTDCAGQCFIDTWRLHDDDNLLDKYFGGLASVMPGSRLVEFDFS